MSTWAKRGARCACTVSNHAGRWKCPKSGEKIDGPDHRDVVTILTVDRVDGQKSLQFAEWPDRWFNARWFRPIVQCTQEQDVAQFAHLLTEKRTTALV